MTERLSKRLSNISDATEWYAAIIELAQAVEALQAADVVASFREAGPSKGELQDHITKLENIINSVPSLSKQLILTSENAKLIRRYLKLQAAIDAVVRTARDHPKDGYTYYPAVHHEIYIAVRDHLFPLATEEAADE